MTGRRPPTAWGTRPHAHPFHELGHVLEGEATWHLGARRLRLRAGDLIWVPAHTRHHETSLGSTPIRLAWVGFDLPPPVPRSLLRRRVTPAAPRTELRRLFELIQTESASPALGARDRAALALRELLILYARATTPAPPDPPGPRRQATIAGAVAHSLAENLARPLSIAALAHYHGLTPSHLAKLFKRERGLTPQAFLIQARLAHARHLLRSTPDPLKAIAAACGFVDAAHLSHHFKTATGHPPARWRRTHPTPSP